MAKKNITKGDELMLFINNKPIAFATSHKLSVSADSVDVASKDHGNWSASELGNISWEITTENLYVDESDEIQAYDTLFDAMVNKTSITVVFGKAANYNVNGLERAGNTAENAPKEWTVPSSSYKTGVAVITSLELNANTGENATYSATFSGNGPLSAVKS